LSSDTDQTVTLASSTSTFTWLNSNDQEKWVAISNQSQGPLTVQFYTKEKGNSPPPANIDPGQPWTSQVTFYMLIVSATAASQVFNIKVQDEPIETGKNQQTSTSLVQVSEAYNVTGPAEVLYTCPPGNTFTLLTVKLSVVGGATTGLLIVRSGVAGSDDWIYQSSAAATIYVGVGPGNTVQIPDSYIMMPGDELVVNGATSGVAGSFYGVLKPL